MEDRINTPIFPGMIFRDEDGEVFEVGSFHPKHMFGNGLIMHKEPEGLFSTLDITFPIPLTPEILSDWLDMDSRGPAFEKESTEGETRITVDYFPNDSIWRVYLNWGNHLYPFQEIKYVHELQGLLAFLGFDWKIDLNNQ